MKRELIADAVEGTHISNFPIEKWNFKIRDQTTLLDYTHLHTPEITSTIYIA